MKKFANEILNIRKEVDKKVLHTKQMLAFDILIRLGEITPVDTAQAVSNWRVGLNSAPTGHILPHAPYKGWQSSQTAINIGKLIIDTSKIKDKIFITNNLDYIPELNAGKSRQAPPFFIEDCVNRAINDIDK